MEVAPQGHRPQSSKEENSYAGLLTANLGLLAGHPTGARCWGGPPFHTPNPNPGFFFNPCKPLAQTWEPPSAVIWRDLSPQLGGRNCFVFFFIFNFLKRGSDEMKVAGFPLKNRREARSHSCREDGLEDGGGDTKAAAGYCSLHLGGSPTQWGLAG